ncbi:hypothetical protein METSCH_B06790 [Metschnikowia aff. pulcherrima]|uniref:Uncharacterized protein n=1 Tax=Metschnikowia aff. pulcherrima TaxID=2163413 RepID=A0A4P6XML1_9ASCO|nr:hypothetical protein METSCH_B06790 [Metschnikowia aff. pulcherrima]
MENLRTAFSLALAANKHITIHTDDYAECVLALKSIVLASFSPDDVVEIDLQECHTYEEIANKMVREKEGNLPELHKVVIWKNLETLELSLRVKSEVLKIFDEIERYDKLSSRNVSRNEPISLGNAQVILPDLFIIVPVMEAGAGLPKLHRQVKDRFWFCQSHYHTYSQEILATEISLKDVLAARKLISTVYTNPEIQEYVCLLMVFTRSHRLCSLAPLTTRPTLRAAENILLLAKTLVAWANVGNTQKLFLTPDFVKILYRKIGFWLVDWETNQVFERKGSSHRKRTEISLLTGDWYGSEWACVEKYLEEFRAEPDPNSTTGYTNRIVEDVLKSVLPPL